MSSVKLNVPSPRFRDIVHFSHATPLATFAHNSVEQLGSFYGRTFVQLPHQDKPQALQVSLKHEPSIWKALAIIIQTLFIVITLPALAAKWLLRRHYVLEIKQDDTRAPLASLPGDRRSTESVIDLKIDSDHEEDNSLDRSMHSDASHEATAAVTSPQKAEPPSSPSTPQKDGIPSPMTTPQSPHTPPDRADDALLADLQERPLDDDFLDNGFFDADSFEGARQRASSSSTCRIVDEEGKELPLFKRCHPRLNQVNLEAMLAALEEEELQWQLLKSQKNPNISIIELDGTAASSEVTAAGPQVEANPALSSYQLQRTSPASSMPLTAQLAHLMLALGMSATPSTHFPSISLAVGEQPLGDLRVLPPQRVVRSVRQDLASTGALALRRNGLLSLPRSLSIPSLPQPQDPRVNPTSIAGEPSQSRQDVTAQTRDSK